MKAIVTLVKCRVAGYKKTIITCYRADKGWDAMLQARRWLMTNTPPAGWTYVVYPGAGTDEEYIDEHTAICSICKDEVKDRDRASRYLSRVARELDIILQRTRDFRKPITALDLGVFMGRPSRWRVCMEFPLAHVFVWDGYHEATYEIVEGRFHGFADECYWTRLPDGTVAHAKFCGRDDLGYISFCLVILDETRWFDSEIALLYEMDRLQPDRRKWQPGHGSLNLTPATTVVEFPRKKN